MTTVLHTLGTALRSIKTRVTLAAVGALVVSVALTSVLLVREAERDTVAAQRDRELREVARAAGVLSRRIVELQRGLAATAALLDPQTLQDPVKLTAFLDTQPVLRSLFSNLYAAGTDGVVTLMADQTSVRVVSLNIANRDYFQRTLSERRALVSKALPSRLSDEPVIVFTAPLRNGAGVYGVLGGALRLTSRDLLDDLVEETDSEGGRLVVVTDAQGQILAHRTRTRIMQTIAAEPQLAEGFGNWLAMGGSSGGAIEPAGLFVRQSGQVLAVAGVAGPDWLVWRAMPEAELLAPLRAARTQVLGWAGAIIAGASLLVLALMRSLLQPLVQLQHRATHLFDGHGNIDAGWPDVGGEIGALGQVLRQVAAERTMLERSNSQVVARLGSVLAAAPLGIMFTRAQVFELVSAEACRLLGRSEQALIGAPAASIYASSDDYDALGAQVGAAFAAGQPYVGELRFLRADGSSFWGQLRGQPVAAGNPAAGTIWTLADIGEHVVQREQLEWSASHDPLTGLGNRKLLEQRLTRVLDARPASMPAAVVVIDLDRFKPINDSAGHAAGDAMLKAVAETISGRVRGHDLVARTGGDEFALLLEDCPPEAAERIAKNVRDAVAAIALHWDGRTLQVGASLGVAVLSAATASTAAWLHEADAACYEAKRAGRGAVRMADGRALRLVNAAADSA